MNKFLQRHAAKISGTISCFDRLVFKGHLPLNWPKAMEKFLAAKGLKLKDFKHFAISQAERLKDHAKAIAHKSGRPYRHLQRRVRKEDLARDIAKTHGIDDGLVCVFSAVEPCQSFSIAYGQGRPKIERADRKCLCLYFYVLDREFGLLHVRLQTWFPFTIQLCLNGHEWLARKLSLHGIGYRKCDNAFLSIDDVNRAQRFADRFSQKNWPRILGAFARRVNPLLHDVLFGLGYYWVIDQAEYATDVLFHSPSALKDLYPQLLKHATCCFGAEDVMTFLGRKLNGNFTGEIRGEYKRRWPGARIKHRVVANWIKMYDKHGSVLRVETVINRPYEFKVRRWGTRKGCRVLAWYPMAKRVDNMYRYAELSLGANKRYLDALAEVPDTTSARRHLRALACGVRHNGRTHRGFNPASDEDLALFTAVMRGEHAISGFRNRHVRQRLLPPAESQKESRRQSARISRLLKRLHAHALIAKIPRSRRWRVTQKGQAVMAAVIHLYNDYYIKALALAAS